MTQKQLLLTAVVLSITLTGCSRIRTSLLQSPTPSSQASGATSLESLLDSTSSDENGNTPGADQSVLASGEAEKGGLPSARQVNFTSEAAVLDYAKVGPTLYFFTSPSCTSCVTANKDFKDNITDLPAGMTIVTVNFDTASALKSKYNVSTAHTYVLIDESGKALSTWQGGGVNEILARF
ncbi:hypothetical protein KBD71_02555 [Candidatus Woesebacteria bacterium]|nr:hypothetical protein [Candidatus Woesebacteria bacterium]